MKHTAPNLWKKINDYLGGLIEKFDNFIKEGEDFRSGAYCNERKVFLNEIRIMKILLIVDLICTLILTFIEL